jgi:uncharacterized protein (TIGR00251 family)
LPPIARRSNPSHSRSEDHTILTVHVQPRARQTEIVGWHGDAIKIRLAAPPVDGAANEELCRYLAARLKVPAAAVTVRSGQTSRRKRVEISGCEPTASLRILGLI